MAKYRSASVHVVGSRPLPPEAVADIPTLPSPAEPVESSRAASEPAGPSPSRRRRVARVLGWVAALTAVVLGLGLLMAEVGVGKGQADFACPAGTSSAVQAATGCVAPPQQLAPLDDDEE